MQSYVRYFIICVKKEGENVDVKNVMVTQVRILKRFEAGTSTFGKASVEVLGIILGNCSSLVTVTSDKAAATGMGKHSREPDHSPLWPLDLVIFVVKSESIGGRGESVICIKSNLCMNGPTFFFSFLCYGRYSNV